MVAGAELANVMNEAAVQAIRRDAQSISQQDILNGMERILQVWQGQEGLLLSSPGPTHQLLVRSHWSLMLACPVRPSHSCPALAHPISCPSVADACMPCKAHWWILGACDGSDSRFARGGHLCPLLCSGCRGCPTPACRAT